MSLFGTGRKEGLLAVFILLVLALIQSSPGLFFGQHRQFLSSEPSYRNIGSGDLEGSSNEQILLPAMQAAGQVMAEGELPLWNRSARFGEPFAFSGAALFYPPFWLLLLGDSPWMVDLLIFLHSALACAFTYRFLRAITMSRYVAFLGGGSYGLGWFMTVAADRLPEAAAAALLPFALERTWRCLFSRNRLSTAPLLGIAVALMFLTTGNSTAWLGLWLCVGTFIVGLRAIDSFDRPSALRALAAASLVAMMLTSPLWLHELQTSAARQVANQEPIRHLQTAGLIGFAAPTVFADIGGNAPAPLPEANPGADPMELALYPGALTLYLLVLGLFRPKRTYQGLMWLLVFGFGLLLALDGPIAEFIDASTGWASDRPGTSLALVHLALVVLAAIALENYLDAPNARRFSAPLSTVLCIFIPALLLATACFHSSFLEPVLLTMFGDLTPVEFGNGIRLVAISIAPHALALTLISLLFISWRRFGFMVFKPALAIIALGELCLISMFEVPRSEKLNDGSSIAAYLPDDRGRMIIAGHGALPPSSWLTVQGRSVVNTGANSILARSSRYLGLIDPSSSYARPRNQFGRLSRPALLDHPLMELAAVQMVVSATSTPIHGHHMSPAAPAAETSRLDIRKASSPRPRARIMFQTVAVKTQAQAAEVVAYRSDELEHLLVLENPPDDFYCQVPSTATTIEWLEDGPNRIRLDVDVADGQGYLLLADAYAPGWSATIDGVSSEILAADLAFRALPIPAGRHRVEFNYRPWSLSIGLPLVSFGAMFGLAYALLAMLRSRR